MAAHRTPGLLRPTLAAALSLLLSVPCFAQSETDLVNLAHGEANAGRYAEAYRHWTTLLSRQDEAPLEWLYYAADMAERAGQCEAAGEHFAALLARDIPPAQQNIIETRLGAIERCLEDQIEQERARLIQEGERLMRDGAFASALASFEAAEEIRSDASLPLHIARAMELSGDAQGALEVLESTPRVQQGMNDDLYEARIRNLNAELTGVDPYGAPPPPRGARTALWATTGVAVVASGVAWPVALAANKEVSEGCRSVSSGGSVCLESIEGARARRRRSTITGVAAATTLGVGVVGLVLDAARHRDSAPAIAWGPGGLGVRF